MGRVRHRWLLSQSEENTRQVARSEDESIEIMPQVPKSEDESGKSTLRVAESEDGSAGGEGTPRVTEPEVRKWGISAVVRGVLSWKIEEQ